VASTFSHTARALNQDTLGGGALALGAGLVILVGWGAWFLLADVTVVESSASAQLEASSMPRSIESPMSGRVVVARLQLGVEVAKGAPLVELDSRALELELAEQQARLRGLEPQLAAIRNELSQEERGLAAAGRAAQASRAETAARLTEAQVTSRIASEERSRMAAMQGEGVVAELDVIRASGQVEQREAFVQSLRVEARKRQFDQRTTTSDRGAEVERLRREEAELAAELEVARARIARLQHDIDQHIVRAPVAGQLSSIVELAEGAVVNRGDRLASILPGGKIRIVAYFSAPLAIGRVRTGQAAWMRLDAFPWTQHGAIAAKVSAVAGQSHERTLRVELELDPPPPASIPLQHGLTGTVEVEVEVASPATLVLRTAGLLLDRSPAGAGVRQ
jgi:multidrug resistance efflux pump